MKCSTFIFCTKMMIYNVGFECILVIEIIPRYLIGIFADANFVDWKKDWCRALAFIIKCAQVWCLHVYFSAGVWWVFPLCNLSGGNSVNIAEIENNWNTIFKASFIIKD
jgi:hypothetical protein